MRYTIEGFSQPKLVELGLNANDAHVLRWFVDFQNTGRMKVRDAGGIPHYFVYYEKVLEDLPILGITSTKSAARIFGKLADAGILAKREVKNHHGTTLWFAFGPAYESLIADDAVDKSVPASFAPDNSVQCGPDKSVQSAPDKSVPSHSSIRDSIPAIAAPAAQQPEDEDAVLLAEIERLQKIKPKSGFLANAKAAVELGNGLTENQQTTLDTMSRENPRKEVAREKPVQWQPTQDMQERAAYMETQEHAQSVKYLEEIHELTGTHNMLELANWERQRGVEIDYEDLGGTVSRIRQHLAEREAIEWPTAEPAEQEPAEIF